MLSVAGSLVFHTCLFLLPLSLKAQPQGSEMVPVEEKSMLNKGVDLQQRIQENLFIRVETSKKRCYTGEGIRVTYKLYTRLKAYSQIIRRPSLSGCSVMDMVDDYDASPEIELIGRKPYYVHLIRKVHLFPLQAGTILLDAAEVESTIYFSLSKDASPADFPGIQKAPGTNSDYLFTTKIFSRPVPIEVVALPPYTGGEEFSGAIGEFTLRTEADTPAPEPGGLFKVRMILSGKGNFPLLVPPRLYAKDVSAIPVPDVKEQLEKQTYPLKGDKIFTYTFTAPAQGTMRFSPVSWVYYDPFQGGYKKIYSRPLIIDIADSPTGAASFNIALDEPTPLGLSYYKFIAFGIFLAGLVLWFIYRWSHRRNSRDAKRTSIPQELKIVELSQEGPTFSRTRQYLEQGKALPFYQELQRCLWQLINERTGLPATTGDKKKLLRWLEERKAHREIIDRWRRLLEGLESELYSGAIGDESAMRYYWMESQLLVREMEEGFDGMQYHSQKR